MKVFKACMLVIKHHSVSFAINIIVFVILAVVIGSLTAEQFNPDFSAIRPRFTIINRDGESPLINGLTAFMRDNGEEVEFEDDRTTLQDATFFHATDLIIIIPQGFHESFIAGDPKDIEIVKTTQIARGFLAESLVEQYLNLVRVYMAAGNPLGEEAIVSAVLSDLSEEAAIEKVRFGISAPVDTAFKWYVQMMNYIVLIITFLCVTNVSMVFKRPDLRMRNLCAPLKPRSLSVQQLLASAVMSFVAWVLMVVLGFILNGANLSGVDSRIIALMLLNSFIIMLYALALSSLASSFTGSANAQNAIANVMTLTLCFLGGVFVPLSMLGDGILAVSRFLPTYWNVIALERIVELTSFEASALVPVWQAMAIQIAFAVAIFCVSLLVSKHINQSERFAGGVRTEVEA